MKPVPLLLALSIAVLPGFAQETAAAKRTYDIAAYVWPSYHPDDRARVFWPQGIGEWETVMKNQPKFEGHDQAGRRPLWGYVNEADRYVMEMQIAAAADHGVNVFIYDWYWYDGLPFLEACLNDGYLKARNNDRVKFYLMWANHDVTLIWDRRNADAAFTRQNRSVLWRGGLDRAEFEKIALRWIEKYFRHPSYYKFDGRPVFMLYDVAKFIEGLGGVPPAKDALQWFRTQVKQAGFPGLELQLAMRREDAADPGAQARLVAELGFDSLTHYQYVHFADVDRDYPEVLRDVAREWEAISARYPVPYYPQVSVGWDASPRAREFRGRIIRNNTPANFEAALRQAQDFVNARPDRPALITVNSWNEWTETSYLQPDEKFGYGYLEAVRRVFGAGGK